jgi:hypothetical protein
MTDPAPLTPDEESRIEKVARDVAKELMVVIENYGLDEKILKAHIRQAILKALE